MKLRSFLPTLALLAALSLGATAAVDCKLSPAQVTAIDVAAEQAGAELASCVIGEVLRGTTSAAGIAVACAVPAGIDVLAFVQTLIKDLSRAPDGGTFAFPAGSPRGELISRLREVK
jgi:hypothetical protein